VEIRQKKGDIPGFEIEWMYVQDSEGVLRQAMKTRQSQRRHTTGGAGIARSDDIFVGDDEWENDEELWEEGQLMQRSVREKEHQILKNRAIPSKNRRISEGSVLSTSVPISQRDRFQEFSSFMCEPESQDDALSSVSEASSLSKTSQGNKRSQEKSRRSSAKRRRNSSVHASRRSATSIPKPLVTYVFDLDTQKDARLVEKIHRHLQMTCHRFTLKNLTHVLTKLNKRDQNVTNLVDHLIVVYKNNEIDKKKLETYRLIASRLYLVELKDQGASQSTFDEAPNRDLRLEEEFSSLTGLSTQLTSDRFSLILFGGKILPCTDNRVMYRDLDRKLRFDLCIGDS